MKILHTVESYPPSLGGMQEVVKQFSERLVRLGHDVTVATSKNPERHEPVSNGVKIVDFTISGNAVRGYWGDVALYAEYLLHSDFDIMTNFAAQQWATDILLPILDRIRGKKVFVPTGFSGLYLPEYIDYFAKMPSWMKQYDMNVFLSDDYRDINFARQHGVGNTMLIPNGAGEDEFLADTGIDIRQRLGIPVDHLLILNVGSHTGVKGHLEAMAIFSRARLKKATLLIIGNRVTGGCYLKCTERVRLFNRSLLRYYDHKQILTASPSRAETVAAYQAADLFLFPSNIECSPIVLFECMASHTPFLTADVGNAAEITGWCDSGLVLPTRKAATGYGLSHVDVRQSARLLERLGWDKEERARLAEKGFIAWKERFSWEKIVQSYEALYRGLLTL
jgi:glycosyltransferase involved in cell wall biosynthesis